MFLKKISGLLQVCIAWGPGGARIILNVYHMALNTKDRIRVIPPDILAQDDLCTGQSLRPAKLRVGKLCKGPPAEGIEGIVGSPTTFYIFVKKFSGFAQFIEGYTEVVVEAFVRCESWIPSFFPREKRNGSTELSVCHLWLHL